MDLVNRLEIWILFVRFCYPAVLFMRCANRLIREGEAVDKSRHIQYPCSQDTLVQMRCCSRRAMNRALQDERFPARFEVVEGGAGMHMQGILV